jgi:general secretion pathway protein D
LETKVVSLEKGNLLNLGVDWAWPTARMGLMGNNLLGRGTTGIADFGGRWPWGVQIGYAADASFTNALEMALNLLEENSEAKITSQPQMFAESGKMAEFSVLIDEYFMMTPNVQNTTNLGYMSALAQLETITSGTKLSVTPFIGDNNDISLEVAVELSDSIPKARGSDLPLVTRRITRNTVTVKDGGTVAVAGLSERRSRSKESKVPGLGNLPVLGKLFTNNDDDKLTREVAVFITARLVRASGYSPAAESAPVIGRTSLEESGTGPFQDQIKDALSRRPR